MKGLRNRDFFERVQESVAHLCYYIDYQYPNLGVPHFSEHSLFSLREVINPCLNEKESDFCNNNTDIVKKIQDFNSQLIIYTILLKQKAWQNGGRMAIRSWEKQDGLFDNIANIYNLKSNFQSSREKLWDLVQTEIKTKITETTTVSDLYNIILKDE